MKQDIIQRIESLRKLMTEKHIDAVVIPQTDPHQSEYLADRWQVRRWFSGFTGSAGSLVVTATQAFLWADSRYWLQADNQLEGTGIGVMKEGLPEVPEINDWLCKNLKPGQTVGIDGMVFSSSSVAQMKAALSKHGINLSTDIDPAVLWNDRPSLPLDPVFIHDEKFAGESTASKLSKILDFAKKQGAESVFIADLAEIAWTLNIRSSDVESNPVTMAFLFVSPLNSVLFVETAKLSDDVRNYLTANGVNVAPYNTVESFLNALPDTGKVLVNPVQTAFRLQKAIGEKVLESSSPVALLKGCKNETQIKGVRNAMEKDGVALVHSFMEIEEKLHKGEPLTEIDVAEILTKHRSAQELYFDQSFDTIAGYGPHGAIVHYSATPETNVTIYPDNLLLIDSGANYLDGTTDITRTIALGQPTPQQKRDFTLVMKGHIALAQAVYPAGTRGAQLDVLARIFLWKDGLSYLHGTGHGVGHFLNVHEGPQSIRLNENPTPLMPGMITSDEPGIYRAGQYGIRCENLILTIPAMTTEFGDFYKFEVLTLFPFDLTLFDTTIMSDAEIEWLNAYHDEVRARLTPRLDAEAAAWLEEKTKTLKR
ncbi:MAG: aminopeptidase P family protein [Paramuribaculum sp.]|nr:aminopeptidase P family protein [Paramuribaculum sp.]